MSDEQVSPPPAEQPVPQRPAKEYPLGVLFVHGIGEQPVGDTLRNVVDPLVRGLDLWIHGAARLRARKEGAQVAEAWAKGMPAASPADPQATLFREQAHEMAWSLKNNHDEVLPRQQDDLSRSTFWSGSALLRDGRLSSDGKVPTHAVLQLHTTDGQHQVTAGSALLAESWWARSFVPASAWSLLEWTFKVLPLALGMHLGDGVRRNFGLVMAPGSMAGRAWHAVAAFLSMLLFIFGVPFALPLQALLFTSVVLSLVPLRIVQDAMRAVQAAVVGTLGDSFLLVASPVSRAMIVARFKQDLEWLTARCEQVLVVGHSQGCAVSYLGLCESLPAEVRDVTWFGSGLRKLEILRAAERDGGTAMSGWWIALMPFGAAFMLNSLLSHAGWNERFLQSLFTLFAMPLYLGGLMQIVFLLRAGAASMRLRSWKGREVTVTDLHATHDPVPNGPLFDGSDGDDQTLLRSRAVDNRASLLGDHTSYWSNLEQVILPLGMRIARGQRVPLDGLLASDAELLASADTRRAHRVRVLAWLRRVLLVGGAWLLWIDRDGWGAFARAAFTAVMQDAEAATQAAKALAWARLPDLAWIAVPWLMLNWAWHRWGLHEQRALLMRRRPHEFVELVLIASMALFVFLPATRAVWRLWGDTGLGVALAFLVVWPVFAGIFYVFSLEMVNKAYPPYAKPRVRGRNGP